MPAFEKVTNYGPLISPEGLQYEIEQSEASKQTVAQGRAAALEIVRGVDERQRLLVMVGPCSIHDPGAARDFAARLRVLRHELQNDLEIVMRCYTEKPRTRGGWKGLVNDPDVNGSCHMNKGLRIARCLFADITNWGVPLISELLDTISPQYLADFLSVGAVGARTTECQLHRELVSGSSFPVGFKNATDGSIMVAIDAIEAANLPHHFLGITKSGTAAVIKTLGNPDCFVILRGGKHGPNYDRQSIQQAKAELLQAGRQPRVMVDCSHGNAEKNFRNQSKVATAVGEQIAEGDEGILGIMIESNINEGTQKPHANGLQSLEYGVSVTDGCIGWREMEKVLRYLAEAVKLRRRSVSKPRSTEDTKSQLQGKSKTGESAFVNQRGAHLCNGEPSTEIGFVNGLVPSAHVEGSLTNGHTAQLLPNNLYQLLKYTAETSTSGITIYPPGNVLQSSRQTTYRELMDQARLDAKLILQNDSISPGAKVLLHFSEHSDNIRWFWAAIVAGCLPAISTPFVNDLDQRRKHLIHLNNVLQRPVILTPRKLESEFLGLEELNVQSVQALQARNTFEDPVLEIANLKRRDDPAVLMLTSGSTGNAKAVCLRHGQILAALEGKSRHHGTAGDDVFLNWIGMDHVANLTEIHLHAMSLGAEQIHAPAADLILNPSLFLELIQKHRVAYSFAPNFFLASLRHYLDDVKLLAPESNRLDLSSLRALISGGEANVVETCAALTKHLQRYHAVGEPIRPGFGMTETCAGSIYGKNCPSYDLQKTSEFACLGSCIPGIQMRVIKDDETVASTNQVGNLQVSGPVVFTEYFNNVQATVEAFTSDGWFITGDRASIDDKGSLHLTGRVKESIIINGVKHFPHELEAALEEALIPGIVPSFTAVFPHRPKNSETETLCVVYLPTYDSQNYKARTQTADAIANVSGMVCGVRPYEIIPLQKSQLPKSSLGKLSRAKIRMAFEAGMYHDVQTLNNDAIKAYRTANRVKPSTETEEKILSAICEQFDLPLDEVGVTSSLFNFGVTSVDLIALKRQIEMLLAVKEEIPLIALLTNPTVRGMANALDTSSSASQPYSPVVTLRTQNGKTPLWLVHPGVGEVLVFLNLAQYITDRSLYALRARGFNEGEEYFTSISEVVSTYHQSIKRVQAKGPYAIAGYSYGAMLAFEIAKVLESQGDEVAFLGSFNLPPHIKMRMKELDWIEVLLNLSYFLDLTSEEHAHEVSAEMHKRSNEQVLDHIMQIAPPARLEELSLDKRKMSTWTSLAHAMQAAAREYDPSGTVASIDVFVAIPLLSVAKNKEDWIANHLIKWRDFSRSEPRFHDVPGAHYTMMSSKHVLAFHKKLMSVLCERGL